MLPRVSIVVPVFNRARFLRASVESLLSQSYGDFELILIDDGSTDESLEIAGSFDDARIRLIENGTNLGIPATRNRGLELARGEYLAIHDSDDIALAGRLAKGVAFLDAQPDIALVGAWCAWVNEDGRRVGKVKRRPTDPKDIRAAMLFHCPIQNSTVLGRTKVLAHYGYRREFDVGEDYDLWVRVSAQHALANLPEILVDYRVHSQQSVRARASLHRARLVEDQLVALGMEFDARDVERHVCMVRASKLGLCADREFMQWADGWFARLYAANRCTGCYPEPNFTRALGREWRRLCLHSPVPRCLSHLLRPPMGRLALAGLGRQIFQVARALTLVGGHRQRSRVVDRRHSPLE